MSFWCLQFLPTTERKQVDLRYHSSTVEFIRSFFGRNVGLKKTFRLCLTFRNAQDFKTIPFKKILAYIFSSVRVKLKETFHVERPCTSVFCAQIDIGLFFTEAENVFNINCNATYLSNLLLSSVKALKYLNIKRKKKI